MNADADIELTGDDKRSRYQSIHDNTRTVTLLLSGLSVEKIESAGEELQLDLEVFLLDYDGPRLSDDHEYFAEMLRQWDLPWAPDQMSALNGLTKAQFFLAFAWEKNATAKWLFGAEAIEAGWEDEAALQAGIGAVVSAAKSVAYAKVLMASGEDKPAQGAL
jgi:hypothetical protein